MWKLYNLLILVITTSTVQAALKQSEFGSKLEELAKTLRATCIARSGIDDATINNVKNGIILADPVLKSYIKCCLTESTAMAENGEFNKEFMLDILPDNIKSVFSTILDICIPKAEAESSVDEKGFAFIKCTYDQNPEHFIFF